MLVWGISGQRFASSLVAVTAASQQYDVKSVYFQDGQLLSCVTQLDVRSSNFGFLYTSEIVDANATSGVCTIRTTTRQTALDYNSIVLRFVLVSTALKIRLAEVNVTGSATTISLTSSPNWSGGYSVWGLLKGWSSLQNAATNFSIVGTSLNVVSNISLGWLLYQIVIIDGGWTLTTGNSSLGVNKMPSQIFGFTSTQLRKSSIDCSGSQCQANMNDSSFCIIGSNETDSQYNESIEGIQVNWLVIVITTICALVFLILLVPTVRYARAYFCPEVMNPAVSPDASGL